MIRPACAGLMGVVLLLSSPSFAQPPTPTPTPTDAELVAARNLFAEARQLQKEDRWQEALAKFEVIGKIRMTPQVRFHIALCHLHIGKLVAARNGFELARREALEENAQQVLREASEHIQTLESTIPTVHIRLTPQPENLSVHVDEEPIHAGLIAVPIPLDPGTRHIRIAAPGYNDFDSIVELKKGDRLEVPVRLEPASAPLSISKEKPTVSIPTTQDSPSASPVHGWVLLGASGVLMVGAGVSAWQRASALAEIDDACPSHQNCDPGLRDTRDRAQRFGTLGLVLAGAGVVAGGAGGYLLWSSRKSPADSAAEGASVSLRPDAAPFGIGLSGMVQW